MRVLLVLATALTLSVFTVAQKTTDNPCPTVSVEGPSGIIEPGEIAIYSAEVNARGLNITLLYKWTVSAGTIVSGQGTAKIEVRNPTGWNTTARVEVQGFPIGCPNVDSETGGGTGPDLPIPRKLTEFFGPLTRANFGDIVGAALREPNSQLYIFLSGTTRNTAQSVRRKRSSIATGALKQLNRDGRITIIESTKKDDLTVIWLVPPGASPPLP